MQSVTCHSHVVDLQLDLRQSTGIVAWQLFRGGKESSSTHTSAAKPAHKIDSQADLTHVPGAIDVHHYTKENPGSFTFSSAVYLTIKSKTSLITCICSCFSEANNWSRSPRRLATVSPEIYLGPH